MRRNGKGLACKALGLALALTLGMVPISARAEEEKASYTPVTTADFLTAEGRNLKNADGEIVNLRGTNAGGYLVQEMWMTVTANSAHASDQVEIIKVLTDRFGEDGMQELMDIYEDNYWTEEDFKNVADLGLNCIRLPFWWRNLMDEEGNWLGYDATAKDPYATAFRRLDWFVETAGEYGLYVILDVHGAPGSQNGSDHSGVDGEDDKKGASEFFFGENAAHNQEIYYELLDVLAARYAGNPVVAGYDLLNEPFCTYVADEYYEMLWQIYDIAYDHVRAVDPDHVVIMEAVWDAKALPSPALYGWSNVMYEYHHYTYSDYDNQDGTQISNMQGKLDGIRNADYDVPSYMGEFSFFNSPDAWDKGVGLLTENGMNWTTWTYKTIANYGMWGLFHHPANMDGGVNLETASFDTIKEWWTKSATSAGNRNDALADVVSKWAAAPTAVNNLGAVSADVPADTYYFTVNNSQDLLSVADGTLISVPGAQAVTDAEKFYVENMDGYVYVKSVSEDRYLTFDPADGKLKATAADLDDAEKFLFNDYSLTAVTLKSKSASLYVQETAVGSIDAKGSKTMGSQTFQMRKAATGELYNQAIVDAARTAWVRYEAEDAEISGGNVESQSFYSGKGVGSMDHGPALADVAADWSNLKYIRFPVHAAADGDYQVIIHYNGDDDKSILVKANDGAAVEIEVPARSSDNAWDHMWTKMVTVPLRAGDNDLYISGTLGSGWINYDYIEVVKVPLKVQPSGALRYEGENFFATGYETSGGSHYSGGKARGGFNQDISFEQFAQDWSNVRHTEYQVYVPEDGTYNVTLGYDGNNANEMKCVYSINGGAGQDFYIDASGWSSARVHTLELELKEGLNTIRISGTIENTSNWANNDYIDVVRKGSEKTEAISGFVRYEGEEAKLNRNGSDARIEAQDFFSGGKAVGNLSNGDIRISDVAENWSNIGYVTFSVKADFAGDYRMLIAYNGDDDKTCLVRANGVVQEVSVPAVLPGHNWDAMHTKLVTVRLSEGVNKIDITGALGGGWMNIDYIDVSKYPIILNADGSERYEAETFNVKSANNPAREHQAMYSGLAHDNGVGGMGATFGKYEYGMPLEGILNTAMNYTDFRIFVEKAGYYDITVMGNGAGNDLICVYSVNDADTRTFTLPNAGQPWDHMVSGTIHVELEEGCNRLLLSGTYSGSWLNYDYIDVIYSENQEAAPEEEPAPVEVITSPHEVDGAMRYEAEDGELKDCTSEGQPMYSGNIGNNGVGGIAGTDDSFTVGDDIEASRLHYIRWNVEADVTGTYEITVCANGADKIMPVVFEINDEPSAELVIDNTGAGYSWDRLVRTSVTVNLKQGKNKVIFAGTYAYIDGAWLNYDYIDVKLVEAAQQPGSEEDPDPNEEPAPDEEPGDVSGNEPGTVSGNDSGELPPADDTPGETSPADDTPEETSPADDTPGETAPVDNTPVETTPVDNSPEEPAPADNTPEETAPVDNSPEEAAPVNNTPEETAPIDNSPEETAPVNNTPAPSAPAPSAPAGDAPAQPVTITPETTPAAAAPAQTTGQTPVTGRNNALTTPQTTAEPETAEAEPAEEGAPEVPEATVDNTEDAVHEEIAEEPVPQSAPEAAPETEILPEATPKADKAAGGFIPAIVAVLALGLIGAGAFTAFRLRKRG